MVFAVIDSNALSSDSSWLRLAHKKKWIPSLTSLWHTVRDLTSFTHKTAINTYNRTRDLIGDFCYFTEVRALQIGQVTENLNESHKSAWTQTSGMFSFTHPYSQFYSTTEVFLSGEWQRSGIHSQINLFPAFGRSPASFTMDGLRVTML